MKFVLDVTLMPGIDIDEFADTLLGWLTHNSENEDLENNGLVSFDGVDILKPGKTVRG